MPLLSCARFSENRCRGASLVPTRRTEGRVTAETERLDVVTPDPVQLAMSKDLLATRGMFHGSE